MIHKNLSKFSNFLVRKCGLKPFKAMNKADDIRLYFKSIMGPKKRILFEKIVKTNAIFYLFNGFNKKTEISRLWSCYWMIFNILRSEKNYTIDFLQIKTKEFLDLFIGIYQTNKVTPYIHLLCFHIPDLHAKYGPLNYFSGQGLEKLNDLTTTQFFKSTNKDKNFTRQIIERDQRMFYYEKKYKIYE